jgi:HTH-type transcriptional regulator / antitoxin HipB
MTINDVGKLVADTRKYQSLEQTVLADIADVSAKFLSEFENGKQTVRLDSVNKVLNALGLIISPFNDELTLGQAVRNARISQSLGQVTTASICGVSQKFLSELENGKPNVELNKVVQILNGLGILIKHQGIDDV